MELERGKRVFGRIRYSTSVAGQQMATFGANWKDDAAVQIDWGLSYIAQRYGSPSAAWQHSEQTGWY